MTLSLCAARRINLQEGIKWRGEGMAVKGPGLKAPNLCIRFQGPEGPCSLRQNDRGSKVACSLRRKELAYSTPHR
jgi:hypothetical protein